MADYIRCPRCELNYILKKDKLCKVCKMELEKKKDNEEEVEQGICPICKINVIDEDEEMCPMCAKERELTENKDVEGIEDTEESWNSYVENDDTETESDEIGDMSTIHDEDELLSDIPMDDEMVDDEEEEEEDEEVEDDFPDDFPEGFDEADFEDEEEEDEDDEDDDFGDDEE
ncbi:MAG: hypothetical protein KBT30_00250 [Clostridiales bacterium]|nr:hypothetical protein [Candidatus Apopatousia equi]